TGLESVLPYTERHLAPAEDTRACLGEFATGAPGAQGDDWPDIDAGLQADPRRRVTERLKAAEAKGYRIALAWPDLNGAPYGTPDTLKF
ncbi:hypothetical protein ABTL45_19490, partial [Acinetobacter baumannii]